MYYLADFQYSQEPKSNFISRGFIFGTNKIKNSVSGIPFLKEQATDFLKLKAQKQLKKPKLSLKQKIKLGKGYLKYRKHLGDTYGKQKGMDILNNQTTYLKNLINPSYNQIPIEK